MTFDGQPVPIGFITFVPDTSQSNSGPGGGAAIKDGRYRTQRGQGIVGGPHLVRIVGSDGVATTIEGEAVPGGRPLFVPYETAVDFAKKNDTRDFVVPKE